MAIDLREAVSEFQAEYDFHLSRVEALRVVMLELTRLAGANGTAAADRVLVDTANETSTPPRKRRQMSAEARRRIGRAVKARWAAKRREGK